MQYKCRFVMLGLLLALPAQGQVVINEIFCRAPNDIANLQWIELANTSGQAVDLEGWSLAKGAKFKFAEKTIVPPGGYLVLCRNREIFRKFYDAAVSGEFEKQLKKSGEQLELRDASGNTVDAAVFEDRPPWPAVPDGASLERLCQTASGKLPENWGVSSLPKDSARPGGTPGKPNSSSANALPPAIDRVTFTPANALPSQPIRVEADVSDSAGLREVSLLYQIVPSDPAAAQIVLPMALVNGQRYAAEIPGQPAGRIVRCQIRAVNSREIKRLLPGENEIRPAMSCLVWTNAAPASIPSGYILHTNLKKAPPRRGGPPDEAGMARFMVEMQFQQALDLPGLWTSLTLTNGGDGNALRPVFSQQVLERDELQKKTQAADDMREIQKTLPETIQAFKIKMRDTLKPNLSGEQSKAFDAWMNRKDVGMGGPGGPEGPNPAMILRQIMPFEATFLHLATRTNLSSAQFGVLKDIFRDKIQLRDALIPEIRAAMNNEEGRREKLMGTIMELQGALEQKLQTALPPEEARELELWRAENQQGFMGPRRQESAAPVRGHASFVYVEAQTGQPHLYDFVDIPERNGGWKVRFGQGQSLQGMTGINLIFEMSDRWLLSEPLAYELHRRAGLAACLTDYVRLYVDGDPLGYHLLIEQPNKAFLRRNGMRDDGNLYKATWMGEGVVGTHEKKTNLQTGHADLVELVKQLEKSKSSPDEQWNLIKREFDVEQVVSHYAVRALISDWDGYFNNYYLYHDLNGSKKWTFYPWDEDKTWGDYDGGENHPLYNMPLTLGSEGDRPPDWKGSSPPRGFMGPMGENSWWRPGGPVSKPLLANPPFRKLFLARIKELLSTEFNEERLFPLMEQYRDRLKEEVQYRAGIHHEKADSALRRHEANIQSLKDFVIRRRQWLLEQPEIRSAGAFDRKQLK